MLLIVCVLVLTADVETLTCGMLKSAVDVLELLLTLKGLLQQLLGCWGGVFLFPSVISFRSESVIVPKRFLLWK